MAGEVSSCSPSWSSAASTSWSTGARAYAPIVAGRPLSRGRLPAPAPHVLVVGIEGATLDVLLPLARQGRLPFFATLFDEGSYARLESFPPVRPLALWASLGSGKLPFRHALAGPSLLDAPWLGGAGELRLLPLGFSALGLDRLLGDHRPVRQGDRKVLTVWEILARLDRSTAVIGAPEALLSATASAAQAGDALFRGDAAASPALPEAFAGRLDLLRGAAANPDGVDGSPGAGAPAAGDEPLRQLAAAAQAQDRWRAAVTASLLGDSQPPAALFLDLPGLLEVELLTLGGFHSAEMSGSRAGADRRAAAALTDYMAFLDTTLAELWERLPEPRLLAVVSAYGVAPPAGCAPRAGRGLARPRPRRDSRRRSRRRPAAARRRASVAVRGWRRRASSISCRRCSTPRGCRSRAISTAAC